MARSDTVSLELGGYGLGWTAVTQYCADKSFTLSRGFQTATPQDCLAEPSVFTMAFNNIARQFSPQHASVMAGFDAGIRIKWEVTANGTTRTMFIGWIEEVVIDEGIYGDQKTHVLAVSWMAIAAETGITGLAAAASKYGHELLPLLVAQAPFAPVATSYGTTKDIYPYAFDDLTPGSSSIVDGLDSVTKSGFDRVYEKRDGTLVLEPRSTRFRFNATVLALTDVAPAGKPGLAAVKLPNKRKRSKIINRVECTVKSRRVDTVTQELFSLDVSTNPSIANGALQIIQGPFVDPNQQAQGVAGVDMLIRDGGGSGSGSTIGTSGNLPTADFQFFSGPGSTGLDVSASMAIPIVHGANQTTFFVTNNSGATAYYAKLKSRGIGVYSFKDFIGTAYSGALTGARLPLSCPYQSSPGFAQSAADYFLSVMGTLRTDLEQGVELYINNQDELTLDQLLGYEISTPISVSETVLGLAAGTYFINREDWDVDERGNTRLIYGLALNLAGIAWALGITGAGELGQQTYLRGF